MNLVTGATGHIGNVLVRTLAARGEPVRALVLPGEDLTPLEGVDVEIIRGDVLDCPSLLAAARGVTTLFHLAAVISIQPGAHARMRVVNIEGTRNVLEAARSQGVPRFVYASSIHALQRIPHGQTVDETIPYDPVHAISAYDCSKAQASLEVQAVCQSGLNGVIVCPTGVIGPYDFRRSEMGQAIDEMMRSRVALLVEGGYDFVDVRDVAEGILRAARFGRNGESYILSGTYIRIDRLLRMVRQAAGVPARSLTVPRGIAGLAAPLVVWAAGITQKRALVTPYSLATLLSNSNVSFRKAAQELGYQPRPLEETIQDTVRWWRERRRPA